MVHEKLRELLLHPQIHKINGSSFYIDQFTGESIVERVGIPGILIQGPACKNDNKKKAYGSFRNYNTAAAYFLMYEKELGEEFTNGVISWINSFCKATVQPAPERKVLKLHGGNIDFPEYHSRYRAYVLGAIKASDDWNKRQTEKQEKAARDASKPLPCKEDFMERIRTDASMHPDHMKSYLITICPKYDIWTCVSVEVDTDVKDKLQIGLPYLPGNVEFALQGKLTKKLEAEKKARISAATAAAAAAASAACSEDGDSGTGSGCSTPPHNDVDSDEPPELERKRHKVEEMDTRDEQDMSFAELMAQRTADILPSSSLSAHKKIREGAEKANAAKRRKKQTQEEEADKTTTLPPLNSSEWAKLLPPLPVS